MPSLEELLYDLITFISCLLWLRATYWCSSNLDAKIHRCVWKWHRQAREYRITKSHSSFLLLWIIKATVWWRLIRDTAPFITDQRAGTHAFISEVPFIIVSAAAVLIKADFSPFQVWLNTINHSAPCHSSHFYISITLCKTAAKLLSSPIGLNF